jgi:hypothetical protein
LYETWKLNQQNTTQFIKFINVTALEFDYSISHWLNVFADEIANYAQGDDLDKDYQKCKSLILKSYGICLSADTPNCLLSERLKVVLKEQFDTLQKITSRDLNFCKYKHKSIN